MRALIAAFLGRFGGREARCEAEAACMDEPRAKGGPCEKEERHDKEERYEEERHDKEERYDKEEQYEEGPYAKSKGGRGDPLNCVPKALSGRRNNPGQRSCGSESVQ
jgi:hypothetical protein